MLSEDDLLDYSSILSIPCGHGYGIAVSHHLRRVALTNAGRQDHDGTGSGQGHTIDVFDLDAMEACTCSAGCAAIAARGHAWGVGCLGLWSSSASASESGFGTRESLGLWESE